MFFRNTVQTLNFLTSHDRSQLRILPGLRNAFGVVLAIVGLMVSGSLLTGLAIGIGAQVAGFAGLNGTARKRFRTMLLAAFWMGITTVVGGITGGTWWAIVTVIVLGFIAGLFVSVSNEAGLVGLWATIALIFISGFHESPEKAVYQSLLVVSGGLLQIVLMLIYDWLQPQNAETSAVINAFAAISSYARGASLQTDLQVASALLEADAMLGDSFMNSSRWMKLRSLLDLAESLRIEVVAINGMLRSKSEQEQESEGYVQDLNDALITISDLLLAIANRLRTRSKLAHDWNEYIERLHVISTKLENDALPRNCRHGYACIGHAYRDLCALQVLLTREHPHLGYVLPSKKWVRSPIPQLRNTYDAVRANLTFESATFRHAIRLAIALGIATLAYRFLPFSRGYWLPLTTLVILKPEFTTTVSRGVARVLGTLIGSVFATLLLAIPDPTHVLGVILIGLFLWGMYTVMNYNMVLFSCVLTAEIVVLLSFFQNTPLLMTIADRAIYTVAGSILAFTAYLLWPTWHHRKMPDAIGNLISNQRQYLQSILFSNEISEAESFRKRARLTRTNAVNLVNQALMEPVRGNWEEHEIRGLLTTLHRFSDVLLTLESYMVHESIELRRQPDIVQFGLYVNRCLLELESDVRKLTGMPFGREAANGVESAEGTLDEVSPVTKQHLRQMNVSLPLVSLLIRMEENLSTMFRIVDSLKQEGEEQS